MGIRLIHLAVRGLAFLLIAVLIGDTTDSVTHGYPRKRFETPFELKQRLDEKVPLTEPQLELITEAYALTRYGSEVPDETQLAQIRVLWTELDRKWT